MCLSKKKAGFLIVAIGYALIACGQTELEENLDQVKQNSLNNFIFVQGGTFTMGDFGVEKDGRLYRLGLASNAPPHQVTLTSFSLGKYEVTWFDYDTFLLATNRPLQEIAWSDTGNPIIGTTYWGGKRAPYEKTNDPDSKSRIYYYLKPASVQWQDAKDYCQWLGQQLSLPIDLATEAQWEYAARSGGYNVPFANALSDIHNPPTEGIDTSTLPFLINGEFMVVPVGTNSTPNHLGFYDMDNNGLEWVNDWYSDTYYTEYPEITDPQGPQTGKTKVVRGWSMTFGRGHGYEPSAFKTIRCAVNSDKSVH